MVKGEVDKNYGQHNMLVFNLENTFRKLQEHVAISSLWLWRVCEFLSNLLVYFIKERYIGYYDGVIFHRSAMLKGFPTSRIAIFSHAFLLPCRIVPGFLVQTGDKTGTGAGGESFYGGS